MTDISARSLASVFGHAKNARLTSCDQNAEPQGGHVNWALDHSETTVKGEVDSDVDTAEMRSRGNHVDPNRWGEVFGYIKNAYLVAKNNDPNSEENMAGHISWANDHSTSAVKSEIRKYAIEIRNILGIG